MQPPQHQNTTTRHISTQDPLYTKALDLRRVVFVHEQNVPEELEYDEYDATATHFVSTLQDNQTVVATLRLVEGPNRSIKVGRVAVDAAHRRKGIASDLIRTALSHASQHGYTHAELHAQTSALALYEKLGFKAHGDLFFEAGIEHLAMRRTLPLETHNPSTNSLDVTLTDHTP